MFLTQLELREDPVPEVWVLARPLVWLDPTYGRLTVPVGFRTDLASTPLHIDSNGRNRRAAAMHDWLYASNRRHGLIDKAFADEFLRAAMIAEGCPRWQASMFYYAVHWFGGPAWRSDDRALADHDFDTPAHYAAWLAARGRIATTSAPAAPAAR